MKKIIAIIIILATTACTTTTKTVNVRPALNPTEASKDDNAWIVKHAPPTVKKKWAECKYLTRVTNELNKNAVASKTEVNKVATAITVAAVGVTAWTFTKINSGFSWIKGLYGK